MTGSQVERTAPVASHPRPPAKRLWGRTQDPALDASAMAKQALGSRLHTAVVPALRGSITDSRGVVLAASIERFDIVVNQQAVPQYVKTVQHGDTRTRGRSASPAPPQTSRRCSA